VGVSIGVGVWANTHLINEAGAVFAMFVATLRKIVTVMLSYVVYPKKLTYVDVGAVIFVFAGILLSEGLGGKPKRAATDDSCGNEVDEKIGEKRHLFAKV